ncbi:Pimeloyl-ACP methyl ester carboxylesterase [Loktanella fryxellensis]|uniref:Pimeloyl-ACP methyl ester carboxylesterase n=1 Tax=Loktanella fryxellensis TaxID=245187 RepID=A0A1H7YU34_9RHOB|nr:alpha/beta fold hydrolase [Loktanella fryxellensis]SEM49384.1 Pimeloyl-ACP methyl ester carboxylesterase [Loktanella fryxellensis]
MLNTVLHGTPTAAPPLLIAHGLFGSARNWGVIAKRLSDTRQVIAVDMRNHGASPWTDSHTYADMAADLAEVIAAHGGQADVLGHSMGGKAAMMLALMQPALVHRLIVADIAPVAYSHTQNGPLNAMRDPDLSRVTTRREAQAMMDLDDATATFLLQSLDLAARRFTLNLDTLSRDMDAIVGWPAVTGRFDGPTLFLRGDQSDYVPDSAIQTIEALFPAARICTIPDAGHWLHAAQPRLTEAAVRAFLSAA